MHTCTRTLRAIKAVTDLSGLPDAAGRGIGWESEGEGERGRGAVGGGSSPPLGRGLGGWLRRRREGRETGGKTVLLVLLHSGWLNLFQKNGA